jgi:hypothetical protein
LGCQLEGRHHWAVLVQMTAGSVSAVSAIADTVVVDAGILDTRHR